MVRSQHVYPKDAFEIIITSIRKPTHMRYSGAVNEDVYLGKPQNFLEYRMCLRCIRDIALVRGRGSAKLPNAFDCILRRFFVQVDNADSCAIFGEAKSDRLTDSTGPAGYQRHFVIQTKRAHSVSPLRSPRKCMNSCSNVLFGECVMCQ
jgi:hypothetical protein